MKYPVIELKYRNLDKEDLRIKSAILINLFIMMPYNAVRSVMGKESLVYNPFHGIQANSPNRWSKKAFYNWLTGLPIINTPKEWSYCTSYALDCVLNPVDGKRYTCKSAYEKAVSKADCSIVGDQPMPAKRKAYEPDRKGIRKALKESLNRLS